MKVLKREEGSPGRGVPSGAVGRCRHSSKAGWAESRRTDEDLCQEAEDRRQGLWGWLEDGGGHSTAGLWGDRPPLQPQPNTGMSSVEQKDGSIQDSPCREWSLQDAPGYVLAYLPWPGRPGLRDRERGPWGLYTS